MSELVNKIQCYVTYSETIHHSVTFIDIVHVCSVVLDNLGLGNINTFISKISLSCSWEDA
jgi:hypothetical protein